MRVFFFFIASLDFGIHRKSCNQLPVDNKRKLNFVGNILHTDFSLKGAHPHAGAVAEKPGGLPPHRGTLYSLERLWTESQSVTTYTV